MIFFKMLNFTKINFVWLLAMITAYANISGSEPRNFEELFLLPALPQKTHLQSYREHYERLKNQINTERCLYGDSVLHNLAWTTGDPETAKWLISNEADVNYKNKLGITALHRATASGNLACAKVLISSGADLDAQDYRGDTPLHVAALLGKPELARLLIDRGANQLMLSDYSQYISVNPILTPLGIAKKFSPGKKELITVLEEGRQKMIERNKAYKKLFTTGSLSLMPSPAYPPKKTSAAVKVDLLEKRALAATS